MLPFAKLLWSLFTFFVGKQQIKIENEFEVQFGKKIFKEWYVLKTSKRHGDMKHLSLHSTTSNRPSTLSRWITVAKSHEVSYVCVICNQVIFCHGIEPSVMQCVEVVKESSGSLDRPLRRRGRAVRSVITKQSSYIQSPCRLCDTHVGRSVRPAIHLQISAATAARSFPVSYTHLTLPTIYSV